MPKDIKRGDNVASSRSRVKKKLVVKLNKAGAQHQREFTKMIKQMFNEIDAQLEVEPKGIRITDETLTNTINKIIYEERDKKKLN